MKKFILFGLVLASFVFVPKVFAKVETQCTPREVTEAITVIVCEDVTNEVCETKAVTTCEDVTNEVCTTEPVTTCETVHHSGHWEGWHYIHSWNEEVCNTEDVETCEDVTEEVCTTEDVTTCEDVTEEVCIEEDGTETTTVNDCRIWNTFTKDLRCHGSTPPAVTWSTVEGNQLLWSAVGGDKVELRFGWTKGLYPFHVLLTNDGHETVGEGTDIGHFGTFWEMRTINGCKEGVWTFF